MDILTDYHTHTKISYCCDARLGPEHYAALIKSYILEGAAITDHSMAIYFPPEVAWKWEFISDSRIFDHYRDKGNLKLEAHLANIAEFIPEGIIPGLETEMMEDGRLTFDLSMRNKINVLIGSVHFLPYASADKGEILKMWKTHTSMLINSGIDILGHPFRWIDNIVPIDESTIREIVQEAHRADVAIELNGHYVIRTDKPMLIAAIETGAQVAFGTDTHHPDEAGNFSYHRKILNELGLKPSDLNLFRGSE